MLALPTPAGLPVAGHRMLAILAFAVIVWMTEAVDYAVSAIVIATLMAFLLGFSPNPANPQALIGTGAALTLAFVVRRRRWSRRSTASRRRRFRSTPTGCTIGDTP